MKEDTQRADQSRKDKKKGQQGASAFSLFFSAFLGVPPLLPPRSCLALALLLHPLLLHLLHLCAEARPDPSLGPSLTLSPLSPARSLPAAVPPPRRVPHRLCTDRRAPQQARLHRPDRVDRRRVVPPRRHAEAQLWQGAPDQVHALGRPGHVEAERRVRQGGWERRGRCGWSERVGVLPLRRTSRASPSLFLSLSSHAQTHSLTPSILSPAAQARLPAAQRPLGLGPARRSSLGRQRLGAHLGRRRRLRRARRSTAASCRERRRRRCERAAAGHRVRRRARPGARARAVRAAPQQVAAAASRAAVRPAGRAVWRRAGRGEEGS